MVLIHTNLQCWQFLAAAALQFQVLIQCAEIFVVVVGHANVLLDFLQYLNPSCLSSFQTATEGLNQTELLEAAWLCPQLTRQKLTLSNITYKADIFSIIRREFC
jgi:hypothetical protein